MPVAGARDGGERSARRRRRPREITRVQSHVELGQVEPEHLDPAPERRQPAVREPRAAVRAQAAVDDLEVGESSAGDA